MLVVKNKMKQVIKSAVSGLYFVLGKGFTAPTACKASAMTNDQIECTKNLGFDAFTVEQLKAASFAVNYIRAEDINPETGAVNANDKNPSRRRFASRKEAYQHGSRFSVRKAKGSKVPGSANHVGFYVTETTDAVNAAINWNTGLTNAI